MICKPQDGEVPGLFLLLWVQSAAAGRRAGRCAQLVCDDQVDAQRDLVAGHDLLARDVGGLLAAVDDPPGDLSVALPEHVQAPGRMMSRRPMPATATPNSPARRARASRTSAPTDSLAR